MESPENWNQLAEEGYPFDNSIQQTAWFNPIVNRVVSIPTNTVGGDVIVRITDGDGEHVETNRFDTREEARDYAREWMEEHELGEELQRPRR